MQALLAHSWPGNIRELRNVIERAVALCPGQVIGLDDLPDHFHPAGPAMVPAAMPAQAIAAASPMPAAPAGLLWAARRDTAPTPLAIPFLVPVAGTAADEVSPPVVRSALAESKDRAELSVITQALERNNHNRLRAAAELGISRMTLYKKLHKYGLMGT